MVRHIVKFSSGFFFLTSVFAAQPVPLQQTSFSQVKQMFLPQNQGLTQANQPPVNELQFLNQHTDLKNITHVRMQQLYLGFPVFGGYAVLHGSQASRQIRPSTPSPASMNGTVYKGLSTELGKPSQNFEEHGQSAIQAFKSQLINQQLSEEKVRPLVYIDEHHLAHWAYYVSVLVTHKDKIPERPTAIIDAETFRPFITWNDVKTAQELVKGRGFGGNELTGRHQFGEELPLLSIFRDESAGVCYMGNTTAKVVDMFHRYEGGNQSMSFKCVDSQRQKDGSFLTGYDGDGFDAINGAFSPSNDALHVGNVIYEMYHNWYNMNPLEEQGKAKKLIMRVHYGAHFENAFWDGQRMTFGDGGAQLYPLVSVGIGAHEISHGFTEQHSDLVYFGQSGGMNESFSDMASQVAEFYATGTNSWSIGADSVKPDSGIVAFRFMDRPSRDGSSIDSADQYSPEMDVHCSSGVYNRLFYLLATTPGWDVRKAFGVMLSANVDYWTPTSTFDEGACGIIASAKSHDFSTADVKHALDQVGAHYSDC